jgi:hypothetical protein
MKILYVTSFSKPLYSASGHLLLQTFIKQNIGDLLVAYESFDFPKIANNLKYEALKHTNIMEYSFLKEWLNNNKKYIPTFFNGSAIDPSIALMPNMDKNMQKKIFTYWNKKASLWFRKVAALHYAVSMYSKDYDAIIWIDCDCIFKEKIPEITFQKMFDRFDVFYHQGQYRNNKDFGFETGFIGFKSGNGYEVIDMVSKFYNTQNYLKLKRWDDGYVFKIIIEGLIKNNKINAIDLVNNNNKNGKRLDAINKGIFEKYIIHNKGIHKTLKHMGFNNKKLK